MDRRMSGSSSRKGSRDAGTGEDSRVVREGDKVYVITETVLQEEEELEQPRSLCLVSLYWMLCVQHVLLFTYNMYFLGCYFATFTKFVNTLWWEGGGHSSLNVHSLDSYFLCEKLKIFLTIKF